MWKIDEPSQPTKKPLESIGFLARRLRSWGPVFVGDKPPPNSWENSTRKSWTPQKNTRLFEKKNDPMEFSPKKQPETLLISQSQFLNGNLFRALSGW